MTFGSINMLEGTDDIIDILKQYCTNHRENCP